jgi:Ala-tRNA(Pro) deacylase
MEDKTMSISTRVSHYLETHNIHFDTIAHEPAMSAVGAAIHAHLSPRKIAKAVVLEDDEGRHLMAVLPASNKISLHKLRDQMHVLDLHFVDERQVYQIFNDCIPGAVPAVAQAYNMNAIYDDSLSHQHDIYLEAGDHETLIHLTGEAFGELMHDAQHGRFSGEIFH